MPTSPRIPLFILALLCADAILVAAYLFTARTGQVSSGLSHHVDLNAEGNFPAWLSSIKYILAAGLLWFSVRTRIRMTESRTWLLAAFPLALVALSCDKVIGLRQSAGLAGPLVMPRASSLFANMNVWTLVIGVPAVVLVGGAVFALGRYTFWKTSALWRFSLGVAATLIGMLGLSAFSQALPLQGLAVDVSFAQYFQMLGATLMLWATHDQARAEIAEMIAVSQASSSGPKSTDASPARRAA